MPMYYTPPSTPPSSPPPSRAHSRSRTHSKKGNSRSRSSSPVPADSIVKTSLIFLGSVAAATFAAHKFWPKGITYGDKEEWECIKEEKKHQAAKKELREEKSRARKEVPDRRSEHQYPAREERRARRRDGALPAIGAAGAYVTQEEVYERVGPSRGGSRDRGSSRDRDERERQWDRSTSSSGSGSGSGRGRAPSRDRGGEILLERQVSRREARYYPPAPQRYSIEPAPPSASRRSSLDRGSQRQFREREPEEEIVQQPKQTVYVIRPGQPAEKRVDEPRVVYEDGPGVVYVGRAAPEPRIRRTSVDAGRRRRYDDDDDY